MGVALVDELMMYAICEIFPPITNQAEEISGKDHQPHTGKAFPHEEFRDQQL